MTFTNPHATPYAFPAGKYEALSDYLNENTQYDTATGCLLWTGPVTKEGTARSSRLVGSEYGTQQAGRLAWMAHHGKKLDPQTKLTSCCGNPLCINPYHLRERTPNDQFMAETPEYGWTRQGSVGALQVGKRLYPAQEVYNLQHKGYRPPRDDPSKGLRWVFFDRMPWSIPPEMPLLRHHQEKLNAIQAIRRCPIRATRTVLPCGFIRYDLPLGITEIAFTELPPERYTPLHLVEDDEDDPASAPPANWELAA